MDKQQLKNLGLKITGPRTKILQIFEQANTRHLSAEEVYRALRDSGEDVGLATVYRVLTQFESAGLLKKQNFEGGYSLFELNQGEHHDHVVCLKCGRIAEFVDEIIEERQNVMAEKLGYRMMDHSLTIYGFCENCVDEN